MIFSLGCKYSKMTWLLFDFCKIPDAENNPDVVALKGRAYLNKGQVDQALKVLKILYTWFSVIR